MSTEEQISFAQVYRGTNRSKHPSVKENMLCRNSQLAKGQRARVCAVLSHKWGIYITPLPRLGDHLRGRGPKTAIASGWGRRSRVQTVSVFRSWQHQSTRELTFACTPPAQDQVNLHSSTNGKRSKYPIPEDLWWEEASFL